MRVKWTDEAIAEGIMAIAEQFDIKRMPTDSEVVDYTGNMGLSTAIQKYGGYVFWAEKLGLPRGKNETMVGIDAENKVADILKMLGYKAITTPTRFPYDILVDDCVKIDVKCANASYVRGTPIHAYRIAKTMPTCDIYVCCELDSERYYIIPAHKCTGQTTIEMGIDSKKYAIYLDQWEIIGDMCRLYKSF